MKTKMTMLIVLALTLLTTAPIGAQGCQECYFVDIGLGGEPRATCLDLVPGGHAGCIPFGGLAGEGCALIFRCRGNTPVA